MGPIEGSKTSANQYMTPGKYPEEHTQYSEHGESLKSGSKAVCPMLQICGMHKFPKWRKKASFRQNYGTILAHSSNFRY
jgi:hypothetical protein